MELSIIILSYNTKKLLHNCLSSIYSSLEDARISFEVIVFDNASTDKSSQMVKENFPTVKLIASESNLGYGKANNRAVKVSRGRYLLFLNSDIVVLENAIGELYNFVVRSPGVDIAGGKLLNIDKSSQPSCGPFYSLQVVFGLLFLHGDRWGLTRYSPNKVKTVDWVSGACLCIKRTVFEKIGGFDEKIFMYMDEIDFLYRAKKIGYQVFFFPAAHFIHHGTASSKGREKPILNIYRGLLYFYRKHKGGAELFLLQILLLVKAIIGALIGTLLQKQELRQSYLFAFKLVLRVG